MHFLTMIFLPRRFLNLIFLALLALPLTVQAGDGERLLDRFLKELQQVTVQPQSASANNTPMALMEGKLQLEEAYEVTELDHRDGIYRLKLSSKSKDVDFSELIVGVDQRGLKFMQLRDQFEQTTDIVFEARTLNKELPNELFEFTPPEGVDVYGNL
jgi:outer membrane lipoprotein carrier protein